MRFLKPKADLLDRTFEISIILKGIDGALEVVGGLLLLFVTPATIDLRGFNSPIVPHHHCLMTSPTLGASRRRPIEKDVRKDVSGRSQWVPKRLQGRNLNTNLVSALAACPARLAAS